MDVFKCKVHDQEQELVLNADRHRRKSVISPGYFYAAALYTSFRGLAQAVGNANGSTLRGQLAQRPCSKSGLFDLDLAKRRHFTNFDGRCGKSLTSYRTSCDSNLYVRVYIYIYIYNT